MKLRLVRMPPEVLIERLQGRTTSMTSNLPNDAELLDIKYDPFNRVVLAIVRSESFEDAKDTYPIPEFPLTYSSSPQRSLVAPASHGNGKLEQINKTITKNEPVLLKKEQVTSKPQTSMIEEEFSKEQRKLLNFSVENGFAIIKPVKFLKAEWDDINETVRSLGGRWVKGDIISYWEIPITQT